MGLKDINYKQYAFDYGEQIGLGAAIVVTTLLILPLFWPGSGFLAPSASANADALNNKTQGVEKGLAQNQPGPDDKPGDPSDKLVAFNFVPISAAKTKDYMIAGFFNPRQAPSGGRQMPELKSIKEAAVALVRFQLPALMYSKDFGALMTLEGAPTTGANGPMGMPMKGSSSASAPNTGSFSVPGSMNTQYAQQAQKHGLVFEKGSTPTDKGERDYNIKYVNMKDLTSAMTQAKQAYPVRAAEIVAAFPYKAQIQEFREKLGLASDEVVLTEPSLEIDESKRPLAAFRFLGVKVQRRTLDAQGRPLDDRGQPLAENDNGWPKDDKGMDLGDAYKPLIILSGGVNRLQAEDPKFKPVVFPGLVMPKLPTFGSLRNPPVDEYPPIETDEKLMPTLKATLDALNKTPDVQIARPSFTQVGENIFDLIPAAGQQNGPFAGMPGGYMPGSGSSSPPPSASTTPPMPGTSPFNGPMGTTGAQQYAIPDVCMIRLFDFTVEPGKTYEYRLQVKMANPNYGRKDAASQGYASDKELPAANWYVVPQKLTVPQDLYFYAVDQKDLDAKEPKDKDKDKDSGPKLPALPVKDGQTTLQIQKWVDYLKTKNRGADMAVGDWVIAERVVASRGELIGRQRVEVPYWRYAQDKFTMASDQPPPKSSDKKFVATMDVPFTPESEETLLADFSGGDVTYTRSHPKTDDAAAPPDQPLPIHDKAPEQVLLYTADGKLLARNAAQDAADPDRIKRLEDTRKWIDDVKKMKGGKDGEKLFP